MSILCPLFVDEGRASVKDLHPSTEDTALTIFFLGSTEFL